VKDIRDTQSKANTAPVLLFGHKEGEILKTWKKYTGLGMGNQICTKFDQI